MATPFFLLHPARPFLAAFPAVFYEQDASLLTIQRQLAQSAWPLAIVNALLTSAAVWIVLRSGVASAIARIAPWYSAVLEWAAFLGAWLAGGLLLLFFVVGRWSQYRDRVRALTAKGSARREFTRTAYVQPERMFRNIPVLSLTAPLDEALNTLLGARVVGDGAALSATAVAAATMVGAAAAVIAALIMISEWVRTRWVQDAQVAVLFDAIRDYVGIFALAGGLWIASRLSGGLVSGVVRLLRRLLVMAGLDDPSQTLLHRVSVTARPQLPDFEFRRFGWRHLMRETRWRLALHHSLLYDSPSAIHLVAEWITTTRERRKMVDTRRV